MTGPPLYAMLAVFFAFAVMVRAVPPPWPLDRPWTSGSSTVERDPGSGAQAARPAASVKTSGNRMSASLGGCRRGTHIAISKNRFVKPSFGI
jgi:hypothetical protein